MSKAYTITELLMRLSSKDRTAWYAEYNVHVDCIINFLDQLREKERGDGE